MGCVWPSLLVYIRVSVYARAREIVRVRAPAYQSVQRHMRHPESRLSEIINYISGRKYAVIKERHAGFKIVSIVTKGIIQGSLGSDKNCELIPPSSRGHVDPSGCPATRPARASWLQIINRGRTQYSWRWQRFWSMAGCQNGHVA